MRRRACAIVFLLIFLFFPGLSTALHAQENGIRHPVTLAELTYGWVIQAIVTDGTGGIWFAGSTCSTTLPTTSTAIQPSSEQACGPMLGRMKGDGTIAYLSYFGGSGESGINSLARGANGNLYIGGYTRSTDFPTTAGAYDRTCGAGCGHDDAFVTELTPDGSQIVFSTYLGGAGDDEIASIAVDSSGRVNVTGSTASADFPTTTGALQRTYGGGFDTEGEPQPDAFFTRLAADGSSLQYSTYLGGPDGAGGAGVAIGPDGDAYVTGGTSSADFTTFNAVKPKASAASGSAFLARFSLSGAVYATYVGDTSEDGRAVAVVDSRVYIGGTGAPASGTAGIGTEGYIEELDAATGQGLRTIAIHGASDTWVRGEALSVDQNHVAYLAGQFEGGNCPACLPVIGRYPTTWDAARRQSGTDSDATLTIVDFRQQTPPVLYSTMLGGTGNDTAWAVAFDGAGGAFFAGQSDGLESVNGQPPPQKEPGITPQSFVAHVDVQHVTTPAAPADIVLYANDGSGFNPTAVGGNWTLEEAADAAGGSIVHEADQGAAKVATPAAHPDNYFELEFLAQANVTYHLWMRMKADNDSYQNDSVWVQFSDSVDSGGNPVWRIGSTDATGVVLEDCSGCGEHGWGWNDNGYGSVGMPVMFATSGWHTIRIQQREDGIAIDQIVLSSSRWLTSAPGATTNDSTILQQSYAVPASEAATPTVTITSPANGATFTAPATLTVTGTASGSDSNSALKQVDIYINGEIHATTASGTFSASWFQQPAGTYIFRAVATYNDGSTAQSTAVTVTVRDTITAWTDADVGDTGAQGSATYANGTFTVQGAGADVWGTADAFHYVYLPLSGDGWIKARVASVSDQASWVKAGVMIRGSLDPSAAQAFMLVSHAKGVAFQWRAADGGTSESVPGSASTAPRWVMIERRAGRIYGYEAPDGVNWTEVADIADSIGDSALIGLAVSSHVRGTLATATFDSVQMSLPPTWADSDIGNVSFVGRSTYSGGGAFTVTGAGADIWGTADAFHYTHTKLLGDGSIVARVVNVQNVAAWAKAGVMMRDTLNADSPQACALVSASKGVAFQRRDTAGGTSVNTAGSLSTAPHWIKLTRSGDTFTAYESTDGSAWTEIGSDTIHMAPSVYIGLAVTSHNTSASATATFDHVSIQ